MLKLCLGIFGCVLLLSGCATPEEIAAREQRRQAAAAEKRRQVRIRENQGKEVMGNVENFAVHAESYLEARGYKASTAPDSRGYLRMGMHVKGEMKEVAEEGGFNTAMRFAGADKSAVVSYGVQHVDIRVCRRWGADYESGKEGALSVELAGMKWKVTMAGTRTDEERWGMDDNRILRDAIIAAYKP